MRILLVAGDPSGDHQGARLARELRRRRPDAELYGYGGRELAEAGVRVDADLVALSAIGLLNVLPMIPRALGLLARLVAECRRQRPDVAVLIDCGAFNLRLGRRLKALGIPVLGYFPPGSWSGSAKRARAVAECYSAVATPFPQALARYAELGFPATLVGHPLVDELAPRRAARAAQGLEPPVLGLLAGSRGQEIRHMLPTLLRAARLVREAHPDLRLLLSRAPSAPRTLFDRVVADSGLPVEVCDGSQEVLCRSTALLCKSGTVTLEAALLGVPLVAFYRTSPLAHLVALAYYWPRPKFWAMPNVLAQDYVVPQLFQYHATPRALAAAVEPLLRDSEQRRAMLAGLAAAVAGLGGGGATERTAELVLALAAGDAG